MNVFSRERHDKSLQATATNLQLDHVYRKQRPAGKESKGAQIFQLELTTDPSACRIIIWANNYVGAEAGVASIITKPDPTVSDRHLIINIQIYENNVLFKCNFVSAGLNFPLLSALWVVTRVVIL